MTDDQDELLNSTHPHYMPALNRHLGQRGTRLSQFTVSTPVCCPARMSLLTGQYAHCSNVTDNGYPAGGFQKFYEQRLEEDWLPGWLQAAGYDTHLLGKFLNGYEETADYLPPGYSPKGFTTFEAMVHDTLYCFFNSCYSLNGAPRVCFDGEYQTDTIRNKTLDRIRQHAADPDRRPFFLMVAPTAPHEELVFNTSNTWINPRPPERHRTLYAADRVELPKGPNFNATRYSLVRVGPLDNAALTRLTAMYMARLRSLRAIDEMVDAIALELQALGLEDNTYIIYSSDNGFHLGQFGLGDGKMTPIDEDMLVPLFMRGPGIPAGAVLPHQANMVDLAPTILALAGLPIPAVVNGVALPVGPLLEAAHVQQLRDATPAPSAGQGVPLFRSPEEERAWRRESVIFEAWRTGQGQTAAVPADRAWQTMRVLKALRICTAYKIFPDSGSGTYIYFNYTSSTNSSQVIPGAVGPGAATGAALQAMLPRIPGGGPPCYKYLGWCFRNYRELYDLSTDPYETRDRRPEAPAAVLDRLDGVLSALAHCKGAECRNPYALLHPGGNVTSFAQAMDAQYDSMYRQLHKLRYTHCKGVYDPAVERTWTQGLGPQPQQALQPVAG